MAEPSSNLEFAINRTCSALHPILLSTLTVFLLSASTADAASLTLAWDPPTDGDTAGYVVWYGTVSGQYTAQVDVGFVYSHQFQSLASDATYCFAVQAYDQYGITSPLSSEVCGRTPAPPPASEPTSPSETYPREIVLYASAAAARGNWTVGTRTDAAGGRTMRSTNLGWATPTAPLAAPSHYFELRFNALANTPYRVWLRLRAESDSKWNDSVWVQFSGARINGKVAYAIGTTSALMVNLERCSGCGTRGWGWFNTAYWLQQPTTVTFASDGTQTIRIQTREDGAEIDQVVLSAVDFASAAPGLPINDTRILTATASGTASYPAPTSASTPYGGTPVALPGKIEASRFDNGGAGVAYLDGTLGNAGGALRQTDVDLQRASDGGYNIGWITAGEWVSYTVNVTRSATYTVDLRVASIGGGSLQITTGAPSNVAQTVNIPNTGGWQTWTTVRVPVTLAAGQQKVTVKFLTSGINLRAIEVR